MAILHMSGPWLRPEDGKFYLRKRVPARFAAVAGKPDVRRIPLNTSDPREAERLWPDAMKTWQAWEADWQRRLNAVPLDAQKAVELAAGWAAWIAAGARLETAGVDGEVFEPLLGISYIHLPNGGASPAGNAAAIGRLEAHAREALSVAAIECTEDTFPHLLTAMLPVVATAYLQAELDVLELPKPLETLRAHLPSVTITKPVVRALAAPAVSLQGLYDSWKVVATQKPRGVKDAGDLIAKLGRFVGHDDASRLTRDDMARWRDEMKAKGGSNNTWNNRLSTIAPVFAFAEREGKIKKSPAENSLRLVKATPALRLPFDDEDARRILIAARTEKRPSIRWAHWVMAFSGMRVGEVLQLTRDDVRQEGEIWCMDVNENSPEKTVKTGESRNVPVHPALIAEGFIDFVKTIPDKAPLFPDKGLDKHGKRGGDAWKVTGRWVRDKVGIEDEAKSPDHAWRHRIEDEMRAQEVPEDARDAITGRARKTTGRSYGVRGEALTRLYRYLCRVPSALESKEERVGDQQARTGT